MWEWLLANGWYLLVTLAIGLYFVLHVLAVREQRGAERGKPRLPRDRC